jgi:hypothetical protein
MRGQLYTVSDNDQTGAWVPTGFNWVFVCPIRVNIAQMKRENIGTGFLASLGMLYVRATAGNF